MSVHDFKSQVKYPLKVVVPKGTFCPKCKSDDVANRKNRATDKMCFDCGNIF